MISCALKKEILQLQVVPCPNVCGILICTAVWEINPDMGLTSTDWLPWDVWTLGLLCKKLIAYRCLCSPTPLQALKGHSQVPLPPIPTPEGTQTVVRYRPSIWGIFWCILWCMAMLNHPAKPGLAISCISKINRIARVCYQFKTEVSICVVEVPHFVPATAPG